MKPHVLIIGGGIAGPALALFLNNAGIASTVFEAYAQVDDIGGGLQISPNGMRVLEQIGISEEVIARGIESDEFSFEDQRGKVLGRIPNGPAQIYGIPAGTVARSVIHRMLVSTAERGGIPIFYRKRLRHLRCDATGVIAEFEDGSTSEGTLLIGADGIHSRTRELIFPGRSRPSYTGLFTVGGFASHSALAPATAAEMRRMHMIFGRNGFFGYAHFDRQKLDTVMWWSHLTRDWEPQSEDYKNWSTEMLRGELLSRHHDWQSPVGTILRSAKDLLCGPVHDVPSLPAWSKDRVLMIGDAAHAISPHAGQGASLALEDAMLLGPVFREEPVRPPTQRSSQLNRSQNLGTVSKKRMYYENSYHFVQLIYFRACRLLPEKMRRSTSRSPKPSLSRSRTGRFAREIVFPRSGGLARNRV